MGKRPVGRRITHFHTVSVDVVRKITKGRRATKRQNGRLRQPNQRLVTGEEVGEFTRATIQTEFLFGPDFREYIDELCERSIKLAGDHRKYPSTFTVPSGDDHQTTTKNHEDREVDLSRS